MAEIRFGNTAWLPMFVAQHGGAARILEPPELADAARALDRGGPGPVRRLDFVSMPWWSWILIWIALVALSLLFYVLLGIRLFRQFMATLKDLGAAGRKLGHLAPAVPPATAGSTAASAGRGRFCLSCADAT